MRFHPFLEDITDVEYREWLDPDLFPLEPPCPHLTYGHLAPKAASRTSQALEVEVARGISALLANHRAVL